jgi:hypothetical protein
MTLTTEDPWPGWVLRFIASDDQEAFSDAVWSVGGSPPYGGVSYEEAEAVYDLLESYTGPGMAEKETYEAVRRFVRNDPYRSAVLDLFYVNDQITSDPGNYTAQMVAKGLALAEQVEHAGMQGTFLSYQSGLAHSHGDLDTAIEANMRGLQLFLQLADEDEVYAMRAAQCAQNAIALAQLNGDMARARQLYEMLGPILDGFDLEED